MSQDIDTNLSGQAVDMAPPLSVGPATPAPARTPDSVRFEVVYTYYQYNNGRGDNGVRTNTVVRKTRAEAQLLARKIDLVAQEHIRENERHAPPDTRSAHARAQDIALLRSFDAEDLADDLMYSSGYFMSARVLELHIFSVPLHNDR